MHSTCDVQMGRITALEANLYRTLEHPPRAKVTRGGGGPQSPDGFATGLRSIGGFLVLIPEGMHGSEGTARQSPATCESYSCEWSEGKSLGCRCTPQMAFLDPGPLENSTVSRYLDVVVVKRCPGARWQVSAEVATLSDLVRVQRTAFCTSEKCHSSAKPSVDQVQSASQASWE